MLWKLVSDRKWLFWVILSGILSACGGGGSDNSGEISNQDFMSRILISGESPEQWEYIWNCRVNEPGADSFLRDVPLRFYRDGQLTAGMGDGEVTGTWEAPAKYYTAYDDFIISVELDTPSPELFVTDNQLLSINVWRFGQGGYFETSTGGVEEIEFDEVRMFCIRYTPEGAFDEENPVWATDDTEPDFLSTGQANPVFVPFNPSASDDPPATAPADPPEPETTSPTQTPTSEPVTTTPTPDSSTSSDNAPLADINSQIKDVWYIGDLRDDVLGNDIPFYYPVIEFNNGEVSRDGVTISNEGIAASKRQNPEDWGQGRVSTNGLLSFKWSAARSWQEPFLSVPTRSYPRNQKLRGCFGNSIGIQGRGSVPLITRLCLSPDGTFNLGNGSNASGSYLIEDHAIQLNFSTGASTEFIMGAHYNDEDLIRLLVIGDSLFRP